jgi:hypothetical protein
VVVRSAAIALLIAVGGCGGETALRIEVADPGSSPAPVALRVVLVGTGITPPPRTITPVSLPGVIVVKGLPPGLLCVEIDGLDASGRVVLGGETVVTVAAQATTRATVGLGTSFSGCSAPDDLAVTTADLAGVDLAEPPPPDGAVALCPVGALFCDDFESGTLAKWPQQNVKYDLGSLDVQSTTVAHGLFALHAAATGTPSMSNIAQVEYNFAARPPPLAIRANVYAPLPLTSYTMVMALYDPTTHGFSIGGDADTTWVVTEDDATVPDHHSDMVPVTGGQWHCLEIVVDAAGQVTAYVDNHALIGPFGRNSAVAYSVFVVGVDRTVFTDTNIFVDDVAIGPTRLYCPQ